MSASERFDAETDLLQRYEAMVRTQIETINGIDDKAAYVARLVAILAGLVLTSMSVVASTADVGVMPGDGGEVVLSVLAVTALFVSLVYAIITYLSSEFQYGPSARIGEYMATNKVSDQEYKDVLLHGYSQANRANGRVVIANSKRFQRCLTSFASGILFFFGVGVTLVLPDEPWVDAAVVTAFAALVVVFGRYVLREEYLTLDRQRTNDE